MLANLGSGEGPLPGLHMASLLTVSSHGGERTNHLMSFLIRLLIPSDQGPTLLTSFILNYFLEGPISKNSGWLPYMNLGETQFSP